MTRLRSRIFFTLHVAVAAVALGMIPWLLGIAYAAADPVTAVTSNLGWPEWFGIGLAALAGLKAVVDALLAFFRYLAPKTKTTVVDTIRDDLQLAHDKLDGLTALVQGIARPVAVKERSATTPTNATPTNSTPSIATIPPKTSQSGFTRLSVMLMLAAAGAALFAAMGGCTAAERSAAATTAGRAVINCTAQPLGTTPRLDLGTLAAVVNLTAEERLKCMTPTGLNWHCIETDAIGQGLTVGGCAFVQLVAAAAKAISPAASGLAENPTAAPPGRAELEDFRRKYAGGAIWHTATGEF